MSHNFDMANAENMREYDNGESKKLSGPSFWSTVLDVLFGADKVDKKTKVELSDVAKALSKSDFGGYVNSFTLKASPEFARFFYDIYEKIHTVQLFFNKFPLEKSYQKIVDKMMSERQRKILEELSEDSLFEKTHNTKYADLSKEVKALVSEFHKEFSGERAVNINGLYNALCVLRSFCTFDYYALLKKFAPDFREMDFSKKPHFFRVWGIYLTESIADFDSRQKAVLNVKDWDSAIDFINSATDVKIIDHAVWNKIILLLTAHAQPPVFEYICKLTSKNPAFSVKSSDFNNKIVEKYVKEVDERTVAQMQGIYEAQRIAVIRTDVKRMFPNGFQSTLRNYVPDLNELFKQKSLDGYTYCDPLSYLEVFLQKYALEDMSAISAELNVYGKSIDKEFISDLLNGCKKLCDYESKITELDGRLNPQLAQGYRFHSFLSQKLVKESELKAVKTQLDLVNAEAMKIMKGAQALLVELGAMFQRLQKDCRNDPHSIISNWNEIENRSQSSIYERLGRICEAISRMQKLLGNFIS